MKYRHGLAKIGGHDAQKLGCQGNFRHQKHGALAVIHTGLDQLDIDRGLARSRNAVKQRCAGVFLFSLTVQAFKSRSLIRVQNQRTVQLCRLDFPAAQHRPFRKGQITQLFQSVDGSGGCTGEVAKLFHRHRTDAAHDFQHRPLHGSGLGPMGSVLHSFLRGSCQSGDPFGLIAQAAQMFRLSRNPLLAQQILHRRVESFLIGNRLPQLVFFRLTTQIFHQFQNDPDIGIFDGLFLPAVILCQRKSLFGLEPETRRKHHSDRFVKGTKVPLPHESCQTQHHGRDHRLFIQRTFHRLQAVTFSRFHGNDHTFTAAVSPSERYRDPLTGLQHHFFRDPVGIGLINGKSSRGNRDFRNHKAPPSSFRFCD